MDAALRVVSETLLRVLRISGHGVIGSITRCRYGGACGSGGGSHLTVERYGGVDACRVGDMDNHHGVGHRCEIIHRARAGLYRGKGFVQVEGPVIGTVGRGVVVGDGEGAEWLVVLAVMSLQ